MSVHTKLSTVISSPSGDRSTMSSTSTSARPRCTANTYRSWHPRSSVNRASNPGSRVSGGGAGQEGHRRIRTYTYDDDERHEPHSAMLPDQPANHPTDRSVH